MTQQPPGFHVQRVTREGAAEPPMIFAIQHVPGDLPLGRRGFLGLGASVGAALGVMHGAPSQLHAAGSNSPSVGVVFAHTDAVTGLRFTPDGRRLASASRDRTVKIWDLDQGRCAHRLTDHDGPVNALDMSSDGLWLASGSTDKTVRIWDMATGKQTQTLARHPSTVLSVSFAADRRRLLSRCASGLILIWEYATETLNATLTTGQSGPGQVVCSPRFPHCVSPGPPGLLDFWSFPDGKQLDQVAGHDRAIISIAIAKSGQLAASGSLDGRITLRQIADRHEFTTLIGHTKQVNGLAIFNDGSQVASVSHDKTIKIWNVEDGVATDSLQGPFAFVSVAVSPDESLLAAGDNQGVITLWDLKSRRLLGFLFDEQACSMDGVIFKVISGTRTLVYSLPCGSPAPVGSVCTCNCVKGEYVAPAVREIPPKLIKPDKPDDERWEQIRAVRAQQKADKIARQQWLAMQYYFMQQQAYASSMSSSSSSRSSSSRCVCIPVYTSR